MKLVDEKIIGMLEITSEKGFFRIIKPTIND